MNEATGSHATDDGLLRRLRKVLDLLDPVPEHVLPGSRALFGLRQMDEELAELVRDSAEEKGRLLTVRGEGDVRLISFETGPVAVELQVTERGAVRDLIAQISGTAVVRAEVETPTERQVVRVRDGVFIVDGIGAGLLRLRLLTAAGQDLVTSWVRV